MKLKKIFCLFMVALTACLLCACEPDNASNIVRGDVSDDGIVELSWTTNYSSRIRLVQSGTYPRSKKFDLDFGYNTVELKKEGYSTLTFDLRFDCFIDSGFIVSSTINFILKSAEDKEFGVSWTNLNFTNTNTESFHFNKVIPIENLLQKRKHLGCLIEVVTNTLWTGIYIQNIQLKITAT